MTERVGAVAFLRMSNLIQVHQAEASRRASSKGARPGRKR